MGGKHKQAQRSKNNARPSSSRKSADLLANSGTQFAGFSGLTVKESTFTLTSFTPEDIDSILDSSFQLVLKKMLKKDSTTKLKALQEFAELVRNSETETVKSVLPVWSRLYGGLAVDTEHRVREATQAAHCEVVVKVRRDLAPYLRQLMGPWFTSQYDTYAPAASIAKKAIESAFPPNKIQEAIVFCQEEILTYIVNTLTTQSPQSLVSNKQLSAEEAEAKFERLLVSSLHGYAQYLQMIFPQQIGNTVELHNSIITSAKFWKLSNNKSAPVKAAFFGVLIALCQRTPELLDTQVSRVSNAVFTNLDESNPLVLSSLWEATLVTMTTMKDWWKYVKFDKVLLPKLWKLLREGGQGNTRVIYPNLLPFISNLPSDIIADDSTFYNYFFENFREGMRCKNVLASRFDYNTMANCFGECMKFVIFKNQSDIVFCEKLIRTHIIPLIDWCLTDHQSRYLENYTQIANIVQYWTKSADSESSINFIKFAAYFWKNVTSLFQGVLINVDHYEDLTTLNLIATRQIAFFTAFLHLNGNKKNEKHAVRFSDLEDDQQTSNFDYKDKSNNETVCYKEELSKFAFTVCELYVKIIDDKKCEKLLELLLALVTLFDTKEFFSNFKHTLLESSESGNLLQLHDNLFFKWLKSKELCSNYVVNLSFLLIKYLNDQDKIYVLNSFFELPEEQCLGWCIREALQAPYNKDSTVWQWFMHDRISTFLIDIIKSELKGCCSSELLDILKLVFTEVEDRGFLISHDAIKNIIKICTLPLTNPTNYSCSVIESFANLASHISEAIYTEKLLFTFGEDLLVAMIQLSCNRNIKQVVTSEKTYQNLNKWQSAVSMLVKNHKDSEIANFSTAVADSIRREFFSLDEDDLNTTQIIDVILRYLNCFYEADHGIQDTFRIFFHHQFVTKWRSHITNCCKYGEFIKGRLCSPYEEISVSCEELELKEVLRYFLWSVIKVKLLCEVLSSENGYHENLKTESEKERIELLVSTQEDRVMVVDELVDPDSEVLDLLYDLVLADCYLDHYKVAKYSSIIQAYKIELDDNLKILLKNFDCSNLECLLKVHLNENFLWYKVAYRAYHTVLLEPKVFELTDFTCKNDCSCLRVMDELFSANENSENRLGNLHLVQSFGKHLTYDQSRGASDVASCCITLRSLLHCEEIDVQIAEVFGKIEALRNRNVLHFLYDNCNISWSETQEIVEVVRLLSELMRKQPETLSRRLWDFSIICMESWTKNILKAKGSYNKPEVQSLITALSNFFLGIEDYLENLIKNGNPRHSHVEEWQELLSQSVHSHLLQLWMHLTEVHMSNDTNILLPWIPLLQEYNCILQRCNYRYIFQLNDGSVVKWSKFLKRSLSLLLTPCSIMQLWGHAGLQFLISGLVDIDSLAVNTNTPHQKGLIFEQFKDTLLQTHEVVNTMLLGFRVGEDSCSVQQFTDSFTYTLAYLLLWDILLTLCQKSSTELRYQYADWLKENDFVNNLLNNLFRLMPTEILQHGEGKQKPLLEYFQNKPSLVIEGGRGSEVVEHLACWIYGRALAQLPALVRQWWCGADARVVCLINRLTSSYLSPQLCQEELQDVQQHQTTFKNMLVKVMPTVKQVLAIYTIDDSQMELTITLPSNYPLSGPEVQCNRQITGTSHKYWLMQLKKCLLHQNGRIWDGLSLWNTNLDKKFDGVEECYICFAVLHPGTYQLPKLSCQTCKKKFHSACLYKWFSTSNKSSCPICRNLF